MLVRMFIQTSIWLAVMAAVLFVPAGTMAWPEAWIFVAIIGGVGLAAGLWFARHDPGLLKQRLSSPIQSGQPAWDKAIMSLFMVLYMGSFVVMALDVVRWRTTNMPIWAEIAGALCILGSYAIILRALAENSFAAPVVRIRRGSRAAHHNDRALRDRAPSDVWRRDSFPAGDAAAAGLLLRARFRAGSDCSVGDPRRVRGTRSRRSLS